jgi:hypothetical protein
MRVLLVVLVVLAVMSGTSSAFGHGYGPWGPPASIEAVPGTSPDVNTVAQDGCPILSPDGLSLYMASNRPGGVGGLDIWVAERSAPDAPFGAPVNAGRPVNSEADDFCPSPMRGGWLFFVSTRAGGCGDADMYVTRPAYAGGWHDPLHLGCSVNSAAQEASPYLLVHGGGVELYFSSNRAGGFAPDTGPPDADIYVSRLTPFGFAAPRLVDGLNTAANDARPNLRADGREIVFDSDRPGTAGAADIYTATRRWVGDPWSTPTNGAAVNSPAGESRASLSPDGTTLYFGTTRPGVEGAADIFTATRSRGR